MGQPIDCNPLTVLQESDSKVSLCDLRPGQVGVILDVRETDPVQADRMKSLGLCTGRQIELIKQGNPLIIRVFGSRLGLARRLAKQIVVDPCEKPGCQTGGEVS